MHFNRPKLFIRSMQMTFAGSAAGVSVGAVRSVESGGEPFVELRLRTLHTYYVRHVRFIPER